MVKVHPILVQSPQLEPLLELWSTSFQEPAEVFSGVWNSVPPNLRWAATAEQDGQLAASVMVYVLPVAAPDGATLHLAGIANVSTRPEFRGQGLSSLLLDQVVNSLGDLNADFSVLYTGIPDHYSKHGYVSFSEPQWQITPSHSEGIEPDPTIDLEKIQSLNSDSLSYLLQRSDGWWKGVVEPRLVGKLIWTHDDAFVIASGSRSDLQILECSPNAASLAQHVANWSGTPVRSRVPISPSATPVPNVQEGGMVLGAKLSTHDAVQLVQNNPYRILDHF